MRRNIINSILPLAGLFILFSCKARKEAASASPAANIPAAERPASEPGALIRNFTSSQFDFKTLSAKAKAEVSIGNNSNDVSMNIRVRKDEVIWVSLTAIAGIEVARAMITPDSLKVLNRLQGLYLAKPFSYIYRFANRQLDFKALQALLIGNAIPGTLSPDADAAVLNNQVRLNGNISGLLYSLTFNTENKLIENNLKDSATSQAVKAEYSNFQNISGMKLPGIVKLSSMAQNKPVQLQLKYNSVAVNEAVEFPFSVPGRYEEAN